MRDLIIRTILELKSRYNQVKVQMVIDSIESIKFRYVRSVTIIPELMHMRQEGILTWDNKDLTPHSENVLNPDIVPNRNR